MKQFWRLTALQLKLTFGIATLKAQLKGSERRKERRSLRFWCCCW